VLKGREREFISWQDQVRVGKRQSKHLSPSLGIDMNFCFNRGRLGAGVLEKLLSLSSLEGSNLVPMR
jgi:hypothetical protein